MSRYKDDPRLLTYDDVEYDNDDYYVPNKPRRSNRSKEYDALTSHLQTGSKEYGYFQESKPKSPEFGRGRRRQGNPSDATHFTSGSNENLLGSPRTKTPNYGRRSLITEGKEKVEDRLAPRQKHGDKVKLPKVSNPNLAGEAEYDYKKMQREYLSNESKDTLSIKDIKEIDVVLKLNDKTTIVLKAVPFKPYQF